MIFESPIGRILVTSENETICRVNFIDEDVVVTEKNATPGDLAVEEKCVEQLSDYFFQSRKEFSFRFAQSGTEFQQRVWDELENISYGHTISYLKLSQRLGNIKAIRAAASANGKNNLPIIIPCHRVIGADGSLTGYAGGLWRKKWLLEHEACGGKIIPSLFN